MKTELKTGYIYSAEKERIEVMVIAKGYCMWRFKGCLPSVHSVKDMLKFINALTII